jgi:hypothetical protein
MRERIQGPFGRVRSETYNTLLSTFSVVETNHNTQNHQQILFTPAEVNPTTLHSTPFWNVYTVERITCKEVKPNYPNFAEKELFPSLHFDHKLKNQNTERHSQDISTCVKTESITN